MKENLWGQRDNINDDDRRHAYYDISSPSYPQFYMVVEQRKLHHHNNHHRRRGKENHTRIRPRGDKDINITSRLAMQWQHRCFTTPLPLRLVRNLWPRRRPKEEEDILATCLHLYDIDIKDGECYMLNLSQPLLPTPTVFDGITPTFPEWACELQAYLNISQFEHIVHLDFAYDAEVPLTTDIMAQQTPAGHQQRQEIVRLAQARQDLRDESALPLRRSTTSRECSHWRRDTTNHKWPPCATSTSGCFYSRSTSSRWTSWLPHHAFSQAEQRAEQPTTSTSTNQHRLRNAHAIETSIRCRSSGATKHFTTEHCTSTTSMDRDIITAAVSKMDTRRPCLWDDTSCHRRRLEGEYSDKQLAWTYTTTSTTSGPTTLYLARSTSDGGQLLCQQLHVPPWPDHRQHRPGHQLHQEQEGQRQERKERQRQERQERKERKERPRLQQQLLQLQPLQQRLQSTATTPTTKRNRERMGATTTTPARVRTSRWVIRTTTTKEKVYFDDIVYQVLDVWQTWTSSYLMLVQQS